MPNGKFIGVFPRVPEFNPVKQTEVWRNKPFFFFLIVMLPSGSAPSPFHKTWVSVFFVVTVVM